VVQVGLSALHHQLHLILILSLVLRQQIVLGLEPFTIQVQVLQLELFLTPQMGDNLGHRKQSHQEVLISME
jgi:hypothetical protein